MRSLSVILIRLLSGVALGALVIGAAWALPTGSPRPTLDAAGATADPTPQVSLPALGDGQAERAVGDVVPTTSTTVVPATTAPPAPVQSVVTSTTTVPDEPDHLAPIADDAPTPDAVVTTTTTVTPPTTTAPPAPTVTVAFSATQQYGSCGEDVPYDVFSGTATPGSAVSVTSPHGSGSAVAGADGTWSVTVEFPGAPLGESFSVVVSGLGGSKTLTFTATGDAHA